jgi:excisionase family DNA binding protein
VIGPYLTIAEAATRARVCERTIRRAFDDPVRPLGHLKLGRRKIIPERDLTAWLEAQRAPLPTHAPGVLAAVSPAARELLSGLIGTPAAPGVGKSANGHA